MLTKDGFEPAHPLPVFLADHSEQQGIGIVRDRAVTSLRVLKTSILIATATAIGIAVLWAGNSANLFADVTASLADNFGLKPGTDQPAPTIQATAEAQASPPTMNDAPPRDEIATSEPAGQDQTEKTEMNEPPTEALFRQFQAWAAEKNAQADLEPARPAQDTPAQVVKDAPAQTAQDAPAQAEENARLPLRIMREHRRVRPVHNARAEMRMQNPRKTVPRAQNARAQVAPAQDVRAEAARARDQSVPSAQAPSFLQSFGVRN